MLPTQWCVLKRIKNSTYTHKQH